MTLAPRVVVVHRRSAYEVLLDRHATRGAAEFFLRGRGRRIDDVDAAHRALRAALDVVAGAVPAGWRTAAVEREDLPRFLLDPADVVVAVGADGLVANVAKHLAGQPVVGVDPGVPGVTTGPLVRHRPGDLAALLPRVVAGAAPFEPRCMVRAATDDGQQLTALNDVYLGHPGHQSARYLLRVPDGRDERQSSSGLVVGTGTGATGWCASVARERGRAPALPGPGEAALAWFVREAWPSADTGTALTAGRLAEGEALRVLVRSDPMVVFGDGMEADRLVAGWGQELVVDLAPDRLRLVV